MSTRELSSSQIFCNAGDENHWRLVEVKSTTDLKEHHLEDVAIQSYVLSHSGLKLASVWLAHVNRSYVLDRGDN